jgi:hypothetical protein
MLPMSTRQLNRAVHAAAAMAEIKKRVTPHTDSGPSRTVIPAHCGQHSGDCGQFLMSV